MANSKVVVGLILIPLLFCLVGAQDPAKAYVYGGFAYSRGDLRLNLYGWNFAVAGIVNDWLSIVGDFSGNYADFGVAHVNLLSFAAGPQFTLGGDSVRPFARVLVGGSRIGAGAGGFGGGGATNFETVTGGGVDVRLSDQLSYRAFQVDWIRVFTGGSDMDQARIATGLVVRF